MLNRVEMSEDEEDASYDVESLFANIFKELLLKLIAECTFSINEQLCKQIDGVSMGGTLSVVLSDCFHSHKTKIL